MLLCYHSEWEDSNEKNTGIYDTSRVHNTADAVLKCSYTDAGSITQKVEESREIVPLGYK